MSINKNNYINPYSLIQDIKNNSSLLEDDSLVSINVEGSRWIIECDSIKQGLIIKPSLFKTLDIKIPLVQISKDVDKLIYKYINTLNQYTESHISVIELNKSNLIFLSFYAGISNETDYNRFLKEDLSIIESLKNNVLSRIIDAVTLISNSAGQTITKNRNNEGSLFSNSSEVQSPIKNLANKQDEVTSDLERRLLDLLNQDKTAKPLSDKESTKNSTEDNKPKVFEDEEFYSEIEEQESNLDYWEDSSNSKDAEDNSKNNKEEEDSDFNNDDNNI